MRAILLSLLLALSGCAAAASEHTPGLTAAEVEQPESNGAYWRLHLDTKDKGIGGYQIVLRWNADVAEIADILPCTPKHFGGSPQFMRPSLTTGMTRVLAIDTSGTKPRSGPWHLLTVVFRKVGTGTLSAKAELEKLLDKDSKPTTGKLTDAEFQYVFP
jgi:hypothetical protein